MSGWNNLMPKLSKEEKKYHLESDKQFKIVYGAAVVIFKELHHWTDDHIKKILDESDRIYREEVSVTGDVGTVMKICQRETKMVMKLKGKPFNVVDVFDRDWVFSGMTETKKDYIYSETKPWIATGYLTGIVIALHRIEKWGRYKRLPEFIGNMEGVMGEWRWADKYEELLDVKYNIQFDMKNKC